MMASMVDIVAKPKTDETRMTPEILCFAAGYMTNGMRGSHGPKTNMVNRIQGVRLVFLPWSWTCECSASWL